MATASAEAFVVGGVAVAAIAGVFSLTDVVADDSRHQAGWKAHFLVTIRVL
jgi:hypothetical protein